jgi:hypothetical protein
VRRLFAIAGAVVLLAVTQIAHATGLYPEQLESPGCQPVPEAPTRVLCAGVVAPWSGYLVADGPLSRATATALAARAGSVSDPNASAVTPSGWPTWTLVAVGVVGLVAGGITVWELRVRGPPF